MHYSLLFYILEVYLHTLLMFLLLFSSWLFWRRVKGKSLLGAFASNIEVSVGFGLRSEAIAS